MDRVIYHNLTYCRWEGRVIAKLVRSLNVVDRCDRSSSKILSAWRLSGVCSLIVVNAIGARHMLLVYGFRLTEN